MDDQLEKGKGQVTGGEVHVILFLSRTSVSLV